MLPTCVYRIEHDMQAYVEVFVISHDGKEIVA